MRNPNGASKRFAVSNGRDSGVPQMGSFRDGDRVRVRAWAPDHRELQLVTYEKDGVTEKQTFPMAQEDGGYFSAVVPGSAQTFFYKMKIDGQGPFPDPWSRRQPFGVHGASAFLEWHHEWTDESWKGLDAEQLIIYELHVGTATREGTFKALITLLPQIKELGATALQLLPVASFSGSRNWGYDGVYLNAPAKSYGTPESLKALVDAAHKVGLGVVLDCVYNHFGPEGNYLSAYALQYFTDGHQTPWGKAVNYDGKDSAVARELALRNAEMWLSEFHLDGLRLDATHAILDDSKPHLLSELVRRGRLAAGSRKVVFIAEDERNEPRLVTPAPDGHGLDGVWADDFHHQLRRAFAGDHEGYFRDYSGTTEDIAKTLQEGWFFTGQQSENLGKPRGASARDLSPARLVHCIQNHDQIGNRPLGDRLSEDVTPAAFRAMSAALLLSPYTPLLYAGQEWNSSTPFLYFTDHSGDLGGAVTEGRRKEFAAFSKFQGAEIPDPQAEATFLRSKLDWAEADRPSNGGVLRLYRELLRLRGEHPALKERGRGSFSARANGPDSFVMERLGGGRHLTLTVVLKGPVPEIPGKMILHTEDSRFGGKSSSQEGPCAILSEG